MKITPLSEGEKMVQEDGGHVKPPENVEYKSLCHKASEEFEEQEKGKNPLRPSKNKILINFVRCLFKRGIECREHQPNGLG